MRCWPSPEATPWLFAPQMVNERPDGGSGQQYQRRHRQLRDQPVRDEAGRARIRIARDAGGNQTRQAGLDDTENKMAMTARNAKVHGDFPQRKGRASVRGWIMSACPRRAGGAQASGRMSPPHQILLPPARRVGPRLPGDRLGRGLDEGRFARREHGERASSERRKTTRQAGPAARSTWPTDVPGCDACQIRSSG